MQPTHLNVVCFFLVRITYCTIRTTEKAITEYIINSETIISIFSND